MKSLLDRRRALSVWVLLIALLGLVLSPSWVTVTTNLASERSFTASGFDAIPALGTLCGLEFLVVLLTLWLGRWARAIVLLFGSILTAVVLASSWAQTREANFSGIYHTIEKLTGEVSTPTNPGSAVTGILVGVWPSIALAVAALLLVWQLLVLAGQFGWPARASRYERSGARAKTSEHPIDIWDSQR